MPPYGIEFYVRDTNGYILGFIEPTEEPNAVCNLTARWSEHGKDKVPASIAQQRVAQRGCWAARLYCDIK